MQHHYKDESLENARGELSKGYTLLYKQIKRKKQ